ncbi:MAG: 23S rRNA (adenine(2503)-C(2))-methyltransferase RlmN [Gemmatimonadota bacterium]|nr:23S rRNA (adenine(2503)-C(2))-methyltransferase RlmN [Gemmatimonadota bacterium]
MPAAPDLLCLSRADAEQRLGEHFAARGQPAYRVGQVTEWLYEKMVSEVEDMTDLPLSERKALGAAFLIGDPLVETVSESEDGTVKHLWRLDEGEVVESVLIPAAGRLTLCISSQAGCAMGCRFCATGWSGFGRQLTTGEIVGQYRRSVTWARERDMGEVTNLVFMGMGEPLTNRKAVFPALSLLNGAYGVGARRITVSTVGVLPGIEALAARPEQFRLALSLHAPVSSLRAEIIPLEKRYPLPRLMEALERFAAKGGRRITFEYTMIRGVNDSPELVEPLAGLASRVEAFVNLIPFNPIPFVDWKPSPPERVQAFKEGLSERGVAVQVREPRGRDIDAACGQLRASRRPDLVGVGGHLGRKRPLSGSGSRSGSPGSL